MKRAMASVLLLLAVQPAQGTMPASAEQILCAQETAFVATVIAARSHDCGRIERRCYSHFIGLGLRVEEMLSPGRAPLRVRDTVSAGFRVLDAPPMRIGKNLLPMNQGGGGDLAFPVTIGRIPDEAARAEFVGKRLVVAITSFARMKHAGQAASDAEFAAAVAEPNFGQAYLPSDEAWVRTIWATRCPDMRR